MDLINSRKHSCERNKWICLKKKKKEKKKLVNEQKLNTRWDEMVHSARIRGQ